MDYIRSLAQKRRVREADLLLIRCQAERLEDLNRTEASTLIDWLIKTSAGEIGRLVMKAKGQIELLA